VSNRYTCHVDYNGPAWEGDASDEADAAWIAVTHWYDHGVWAGEDVPSKIVVVVADIGDPTSLMRLPVYIDWSPDVWVGDPITGDKNDQGRED